MNQSIRLPELRQNLQLMPGSSDEDGAPRWLLFDALQNRYFTLSDTAVDLFRHWQPGKTPDEFKELLEQQNIRLEAEEITAFIQFLTCNNLIKARQAGESEQVYQQHLAGIKGLWSWWLHNYLFIRIPLVRPDKWLNRWVEKLGWLFLPLWFYCVMGTGLLGIALVIRQWDVFSATFMYFFNTNGLVFYVLSLIFVKCIHELGHAFAAKRQGCKVASMGIAFLVMFPVLYTDTTDAWKLNSRSARLKIVTAGVKAELYLALIATFLWNILPDGALRSAAFFIATTSWITSVLVNISPFLRFDGYYAFSDLLGVENLQHRAFAMGRWQLRKTLWGIDDRLPEPMPRNRARLLIGYAWATWLYRLFLFLGIALLVYHFFFKVLGIFLFLVEIIWFIALPVVREIKVWRQRKSDFKFNHYRAVAWVSVAFIFLWAALPMQVQVNLPAVLVVSEEQTIYSPQPAMVKQVKVENGNEVFEGQILVQLHSDDLMFQLQQIEEKIVLEQSRLNRSAGFLEDKRQRLISEQRLLRLQEQSKGLKKQISQLNIKAPVSGQIRYAEVLHPGRWVHPDLALYSVVNADSFIVEGFISEKKLGLIEEGVRGSFIANQGDIEKLTLKVEEVSVGAIYALPYAELGSVFSGDIAVRKTGENTLIPEQGLYRVRLTVTGIPPENISSRISGVVIVDGKPRSWLWHQIETLFAGIIRQSGF